MLALVSWIQNWIQNIYFYTKFGSSKALDFFPIYLLSLSANAHEEYMLRALHGRNQYRFLSSLS